MQLLGDVKMAPAITVKNSNIEVMTPTQFNSCFGWSPELHGRGLRLSGLVFSVASLYAVEQLLTRNGIAFTKSDGRVLVHPAAGQGHCLYLKVHSHDDR